MNATIATDTLPDVRREVTLLEENLRRQIETHRKLLDCIGRTREAVRVADMRRIRSICEEQNAVAQELAELEKVRLMLVGRLTERLEPDAERPVSLSRIAAELDEPAGGRFRTLATQLRSTVDEVRKASAVVRTATDALSRHMSGLLQSVQSAIGHATVYGRRGRLETGEQNQFCVDIRS